MIRIIDRGPLDNRTSDIGTMELYGSSVINNDPFDLLPSAQAAGAVTCRTRVRGA